MQPLRKVSPPTEASVESSPFPRATNPGSVEKAADLGIAERAETTQQQSEQSPPTKQPPQGRKGKRPARRRLGEVFLDWGLITEAQLMEAIAAQKADSSRRLGQVLIDQKVLSEDDVVIGLAEKFGLAVVDLDDITLDITALNGIDSSFLGAHQVLPISTDDNTLTVAVSDPLALDSLDLLRFSTGKAVKEVLAKPGQLAEYVESYLASIDEGANGDLQLIMQELESDFESPLPSRARDVTINAADRGVAKLVNRMIIDAINRKASDIHVEPNGPELDTTVRFRVDGACIPYWRIPGPVSAQVVSRIKIMANLKITERALPQDGKIRFRLGSKRQELRVATIPTLDRGEDVVMRVLGSGTNLTLGHLDFSQRNLETIERLITEPYGMILAVGPTGSGKTTTLHSILGALNTVERKIWTAEDPVEITQPGLRQVQVHPGRGFDFARALRAFLRGDPDVIMVGEMRDLETATIAVEASLTGHLLLSTLHTNSAAETVSRLNEMGIESFTFSDALVGIVAQRLARRLCGWCRQEALPTEDERRFITQHYGESELEERLAGRPLTLWKATGCPRCNGKGHRGRVALHEVLVKDDAIRSAIQGESNCDEVRKLAIAGGMRTLLQDGIDKSIAGLTDLKQVLTVVSSR